MRATLDVGASITLPLEQMGVSQEVTLVDRPDRPNAALPASPAATGGVHATPASAQIPSRSAGHRSGFQPRYVSTGSSFPTAPVGDNYPHC
jgi:hypothetical protein